MGRSPPTPSTHTAREVVHESPAEALALITVVDDADRAEFEESLGTEIRDEVDGGPAGRRDQYYVVTRVTPMTETNKVLVGVDLSMDPVRSDAIERALASGETVISAPLGSLPTGRPAVFVAKPLYRPGADGSPRMEEPVGLVTTGYQGLRLLEEITAQLPSGTRLELQRRRRRAGGHRSAPRVGHRTGSERGGPGVDRGGLSPSHDRLPPCVAGGTHRGCGPGRAGAGPAQGAHATRAGCGPAPRRWAPSPT